MVPKLGWDTDALQGGNSGLSGGSVPLFDEVILLTHNLDKIISFDKVSLRSLMLCTV